MRPPSLLSSLPCLLVLICCCALHPLRAQSTESDLKTRLQGQPLYLRGGWSNDYLHFDASGKLKGTSPSVPFTLGGFNLKSIKLKQDRLVLSGQRVGLELNKGKQRRVPVTSISVEIEADSTGDYGPALDRIFSNGLASLIPTLPSYWKSYALENFVPGATPKVVPPAVPTVPKRAIIQPKLLSSGEPAFSAVAYDLKYGGKELISLQVDTEGKVTHLSIVQALGLGLDEMALGAIQKYVFAPATANGVPVAVELKVEVNFQIF